MAVGVFDSGLGGLTVLDAVTRRLPDVPFVYYGDNAHAPYGVRTSDDIFDLTCAGVERLWAELEANPGMEATVDLEARTVTVGNITVPFEIDDYTRWRLLEGLDDIGLTLRDEQAITDFEARREAWRPTTLPAR